MYNKIRQIQLSNGNKKLLVVKTNEKRKDFQDNVDKILERVSRTLRH